MAIRELCQGCHKPQAIDDCTFDKSRHLCSECQQLKVVCPYCTNWDFFFREGPAQCQQCKRSLTVFRTDKGVTCERAQQEPIKETELKDFTKCHDCGITIRVPENMGDLTTFLCTPCADKAFGKLTHHDPVNHPKHYNESPAKCSACRTRIECIDVTRHMSFNIGNAVKYLWRYQLKNGVEDLKKAQWYLTDAINSMERKQ